MIPGQASLQGTTLIVVIVVAVVAGLCLLVAVAVCFATAIGLLRASLRQSAEPVFMRLEDPHSAERAMRRREDALASQQRNAAFSALEALVSVERGVQRDAHELRMWEAGLSGIAPQT